MHQHTHTGLIQFVSVTVMAVVGINLWRLGAAWLADKQQTEMAGKALGALVHFGS